MKKVYASWEINCFQTFRRQSGKLNMKRKHNVSSSENPDSHHHILPANARVIHVSYDFSFHLSEICRLSLIDRCTNDAFLWHVSMFHRLVRNMSIAFLLECDISHSTGLLANFFNHDQFQSVLFGCLCKLQNSTKNPEKKITFLFKRYKRDQILLTEIWYSLNQWRKITFRWVLTISYRQKRNFCIISI